MEKMNNPFFQKDFYTPHNTIPFDKIDLSHYEPAIEKGMEEEKEEINQIVNNPDEPTFHNTIEMLDKSGSLLELVTTVLGNMLNAECPDELHEIAQRVMPKLSKHSNDIALNENLFKKIKTVKENVCNTDLTNEQEMLVEKYYKSFVRNGALLEEHDKSLYREYTEQLSVLSLKFEQNNLKDKNRYELNITDEKDLDGIPENIRNIAKEKAKEKNHTGWTFTLDAPLYIPFMKYSTKRDLRKQLYLAYNTICTQGEYSNNYIIKEIVNLRRKIANLLGYNTFADYVLDNRMAENTENVYHLLNELKDRYTPKAKEETKAVAETAKELDGIEEIMPWDWAYYSEILRKKKHNLDDEKLREYFELNSVINGVFGLANKLYGIKFKENNDIPKYHKDVKCYEVYDKDDTFLAILYTDFYPRATKQSGAWMTEFKEQWKDGNQNSRPHVSLVMNFTPSVEGKPSLITHSELNTFLHEFGHALHGMLSNVTYKSLSGTNVYRDFVELPSQIMENFATEKEFLNTFAKHYKTGDFIQEQDIENIKNAENFNVGYACLRQVSFGLLDMAWHTIDKDFNGDVESFEKDIFKQTSLLPQINATCMSTQFGHIFSGGYAAGYYGYKWAEVLDADAFSLFKEHGIFNKETANSFRENILSKGGSEHPMDLYIKFRGKKPTIEALLKRNGIIL